MENSKNIVGFIFLIIIILIFIFGGYYLMNYTIHNENKTINEKKEEVTELREDLSKDYLYYDNSVEFFESEEIEKKDVIFNFKTLTDLNAALHQELEDIYNNVVKIENVQLPDGVEVTPNSEGYYSFSYREYIDTVFDNYISLVVLDYNYDCISGSKIEKLKSYVVDKTKGELLSNQELLSMFNITEDTIIESVTTRLNNTQVLDGDEQVIDITGTIDAIKASDYESGVKALSVSKNGKLAINFIVKSNKINYNDSIELN